MLVFLLTCCHQALLYSCCCCRNQDFKEVTIEQSGEAVLRFAIAYGFRNIQNIVPKIKRSKLPYDFVEVMACPSGRSVIDAVELTRIYNILIVSLREDPMVFLLIHIHQLVGVKVSFEIVERFQHVAFHCRVM